MTTATTEPAATTEKSPSTNSADSSETIFDSGSFRDRHSRVFRVGNDIYRALDKQAADEWQAFAECGLAESLQKSGQLISTTTVESTDSLEIATTVPDLEDGVDRVLKHTRVPFISYPEEWTFSMLKDAALLQLDLLLASLKKGFTTNDATPFNVQWFGAQPTFIDVGSFERLEAGDAWAGYRQFCMLNLYPLMLNAWKRYPLQSLLRGNLDGISPSEMKGFISLRDRLRKGVLGNIILHARFEQAYNAAGGAEKKKARDAEFTAELLSVNARKLKKLINNLDWTPPGEGWTQYGVDNTYTEDKADAKHAFVTAAAQEVEPRLTWDIGCNNGKYALAASKHSSYTVALDMDHGTVEHLYRRLKAQNITNVLPLVSNLLDQQGGRGWATSERTSLQSRGNPDLVLCLALVHHLSISGNVPLPEVVRWLRSLNAAVVVEYVDRHDPMTSLLLERKRGEKHADYTRESFENALNEHFNIVRSEAQDSGERVLYFVKPH